MVADGPDKITRLLKAWKAGDDAAQEELVPLVYQELRRLAHYYRQRAKSGETLQTTALVHEAYLRLVKIDSVDWKDRAHFFAVSAQLMRRILIDSARAGDAAKRGGADPAITGRWDMLTVPSVLTPDPERLLILDDALNRLAALDERRSKTVELRVFGGLTVEETAEVLGVSPPTVVRDWRLAKAWLMRELGS